MDITPTYLNLFLNDINIDSLEKNNYFEMKYHFNIAPKGYKDPEACKDMIRLYFDNKFCHFVLIIDNTFLVEPDWCTESSVLYHIEIEKNNIKYFGRQEAG